jgi:predicted AlkP superfamily phosphohydrolase/phosphomutase
MKQKIAIIGLDCASPQLVFEKWIDHLPNLKKLIKTGISAPLQSCDPPITIPAWSVMFSGKDPGQLGVYGFRNRIDYSYNNLKIADSSWIKDRRLWDYFTEVSKNSIVIGVPQTYPVTPMQGIMISGLLAEELDSNSVYPVHLLKTIKQNVPDYEFDVKNFRTDNKENLIKKIYQMTMTRFRFARHLLDTTDWDGFILVEIGLDRLQHAFWQFMDDQSTNYQPNSRFKDVILKYYQYLDFEIGTLLKRFDENTDIMIVSDHGAKAFKGGFCINQWLMENGYLRLKEKFNRVKNLSVDMVDWEKTKVWAEGGYYARCFFNIKGREKRGIIDSNEVVNLKEKIKSELNDVRNLKGNLLKNNILFPEDIYKECKGIAPDMMVYPDDLNYRAIGSIGWDSSITHKNDTGPDGANHDYEGIFIFSGKGIKHKREKQISIYDITPTVLNRMDISFPKDLNGKIIL